MRLAGGFRQGLGAGAFLARAGQRRVGGLGMLVGFRQHGFGLLAGVGRLIARGLGGGDGIQQGAALLRDLFGHQFGAGQFAGQFFLAAGQFGDMALGIALARIPARLVITDCRKTRAARLAFAAQAFQRGTGLARLGAGIGGSAARIGDILIEHDPVAQFFQPGDRGGFGFLGRFHGLRQAADFRFQRRQLRGALGGGARGAGGPVLGADQRLFGGALIGFGGAQGVARRLCRIFCRGIVGKLGGTLLPGNFVFAFQGGEAVAL